MNIAICGLGRAGIQIVRFAMTHPEHDVSMAFCRDGGKKAGKTISDVFPLRGFKNPIYEVSAAESIFAEEKPDALIDFSSVEATMQILPACAKYGVKHVIGTTGFSTEQMQTLRDTAENTPGFALAYTPNVTVGVNVLMMLCEQTALALPDFDYAITEKHHNRKEDISATAQKIAASLEGILGKHVQVNSIRAGGYVGLHEVLIVGEFERLTIIHESFSRQAFANGAIIAAQYLMGREGFYEMRDIVAHHLGNTPPA